MGPEDKHTEPAVFWLQTGLGVPWLAQEQAGCRAERSGPSAWVEGAGVRLHTPESPSQPLSPHPSPSASPSAVAVSLLAKTLDGACTHPCTLRRQNLQPDTQEGPGSCHLHVRP